MRSFLLCLVVALAACGPTDGPRATPAVEPGARPTTLRVDHAWVKNAPSQVEQAPRRTAMEALRAKAARGEPFVAAWESLRVDGEPWHVAEAERYPYDVIPAAARDLAVGTLSPIIPGDGGIHLFRILGRE